MNMKQPLIRGRFLFGGGGVSIFERLAWSQPEVLLALAEMGLFVIEDYLPGGIPALMRHAAWRRGHRGRMRQVRCA